MLLAARPDLLAVHLLADQLEALEQASDRLMELAFAGTDAASGDDAEDILDRLADLSGFVNRLETGELAIVAKLGQARLWAGAVAASDIRLRSFAGLFHAGTQALADQIERLAEPAADLFESGARPAIFLRQRDLLAMSGALADGTQPITVGRSYRLCGVTEIGDLIDLCQATLNALDAHYGIYELEEPPAETADMASYDPAVASVEAMAAVAPAEDVTMLPQVAETIELAAMAGPADRTTSEAPSAALEAVAKASAVVAAAAAPDPVAEATEAIAEALAEPPIVLERAVDLADAVASQTATDAPIGTKPGAEQLAASDGSGTADAAGIVLVLALPADDDVVELENAMEAPGTTAPDAGPTEHQAATDDAIAPEKDADTMAASPVESIVTETPAGPVGTEVAESASDTAGVVPPAAETSPEPDVGTPEETTECLPSDIVARPAAEPCASTTAALETAGGETGPDEPAPVEPAAALTAGETAAPARPPPPAATATDATAPLAKDHTLAARLEAIKSKRAR